MSRLRRLVLSDRGWRGHPFLMSAKVPVTLSATKGLGISLANAGILRFAQNDSGVGVATVRVCRTVGFFRVQQPTPAGADLAL
jgi:hypothetical protein